VSAPGRRFFRALRFSQRLRLDGRAIPVAAGNSIDAADVTPRLYRKSRTASPIRSKLLTDRDIRDDGRRESYSFG